MEASIWRGRLLADFSCSEQYSFVKVDPAIIQHIGLPRSVARNTIAFPEISSASQGQICSMQGEVAPRGGRRSQIPPVSVISILLSIKRLKSRPPRVSRPGLHSPQIQELVRIRLLGRVTLNRQHVIQNTTSFNRSRYLRLESGGSSLESREVQLLVDHEQLLSRQIPLRLS